MQNHAWTRWIVLGTLTVGISPAAAQSISIPVAFDRWMYPFNATPGSRATGSVFGANDEGFDNRDAQILVGFDVSSAVAPSPQHRLVAVDVQFTTAAADLFLYDPTADSVESYLTGVDADAGRPLELFGVGTRNGFDGLSLTAQSSEPPRFQESTRFSTQPGVFRSSRSAFAADYQNGTAVDVSNNVSAQVDVTAWATGQAENLAAGASVPVNTAFSFPLNLADADIAGYVAEGMSRGELYFALTSLHGASLEGPPTFPSFYLDAGGASLGATAVLTLEFAAATAGDFDANGVLDAADIDLLTHAINSGETDAQFDLNTDGSVASADRTVWIEDLKHTWFGDTNLDGEFNSGDLVHVFQQGEYEDAVGGNSLWSDGDWNGDGDFDSSDFVIAFAGGGFEQGPRAAVASVPEPCAAMLSWLGLCSLAVVTRRAVRQLAVHVG